MDLSLYGQPDDGPFDGPLAANCAVIGLIVMMLVGLGFVSYPVGLTLAFIFLWAFIAGLIVGAVAYLLLRRLRQADRSRQPSSRIFDPSLRAGLVAAATSVAALGIVDPSLVARSTPYAAAREGGRAFSVSIRSPRAKTTTPAIAGEDVERAVREATAAGSTPPAEPPRPHREAAEPTSTGFLGALGR